MAKEQLRIGQVWEWEPTARRIFDNRMAPKEERRWQPALRTGIFGRTGFAPAAEVRREEPLAPVAGVARRLRVVVSHVRLTKENGDWMKKTAATAASAFAPAIAELDQHYPYARYLFWSETELATGTRVTATPEELSRRSQARPTQPR